MTKDEIKKALEICADDCYSCDDCPYDDVINCGNTLKNDVYELIIKQEREIERLKAENYELTKKLEARLTCDFVKTAQKHAKIDVLNQVKTYSYCDNVFMDGKWHRDVFESDIDELIKEVEK